MEHLNGVQRQSTLGFLSSFRPIDRRLTGIIVARCFAGYRQHISARFHIFLIDHRQQIRFVDAYHLATVSKQMHSLYLAIVIACFAVMITAIFTAIHRRRYYRETVSRCLKLEILLAQRTKQLEDALDCARLIAITRQGRCNIFTFSRCKNTFQIETMGILSDNPDEWRRLSGLQT